MKIHTTREGSAASLALEGRLDREWAEHLSGALERLLQEGARTLRIDLSRVTYVSSAATRVLARWQQELAMLRGEVRLMAVPAVVREAFAVVGWEFGVEASEPHPSDLLQSSWHARADLATKGLYELSAILPAGRLTCRLHGDPGRLSRAPYGPTDCDPVAFPEETFGLGLGAIGARYEECHERFGELVAAGGCIAYFPSDGARMADYLVGAGRERIAPRAVLATGISCDGGFSHLIRFSPQPDAGAIPLSELAAIGLDAAGGGIAGLVIAGETAGISGARLRRSPAGGASPLTFDLPAVRDWLLFSPERTHVMTTTVIVGVVARAAAGPLASHLRPLGISGRLFGHFHAAVLSYCPLPQRTVELTSLLRDLFANHQLRDVLHLVWDTREGGVRESELIRGVAWAAPAELN